MSNVPTLAACAYQMPGRTIQGTINGTCGKYELRIRFCKGHGYDLSTKCMSHGIVNHQNAVEDCVAAVQRSLLAQSCMRPTPPGIG